MRVFLFVIVVFAAALPAAARDSNKGAGADSPRAAYSAMAPAERVSIQSDLIWTTDCDCVADGEITDATIAAIRSFQKQIRSKPTGVLNPQERELLAAAARKARDATSWRVIDDTRSGARVGLPGKILSQSDRGKSGTRWTSVHGEVIMETFRANEPGTTLAAVFEKQKNEPLERRVESSQLRPDSFSISGLQGLKRFFVRGWLRDKEVRGLTVLYDQALDGTMEPLLRPIWSSYVPFAPISAAAVAKAGPVSGKVEYGTGIVVSAQGDIVTARQQVNDCEFVVVAGFGHADRIAEDERSDTALLRVYGGHGLKPLPIAAEADHAREVTLVGIADPQTQGGGAKPSSTRAQLGAESAGARSIDPTPSRGFGGAAVLAGNGFAGMAQIKPQLLAGAAPATLPAPATLVPAEKIRSFLAAHGVQIAAGASDANDAKSSVVRIICVRK
ncbi:MAG TPA: trypsin-like peptidase domain-containing protein [Xanthobacteraceae bacterium]|nr:trypsin-like peptidase domain-containing protein [Xanthobacteraceae bacterium]